MTFKIMPRFGFEVDNKKYTGVAEFKLWSVVFDLNGKKIEIPKERIKEIVLDSHKYNGFMKLTDTNKVIITCYDLGKDLDKIINWVKADKPMYLKKGYQNVYVN